MTDWPQDTTEHHKPARRAKGRAEAMPVLSAKFMSARDVTDQDLRGFNMGDEQQ